MTHNVITVLKIILDFFLKVLTQKGEITMNSNIKTEVTVTNNKKAFYTETYTKVFYEFKKGKDSVDCEIVNYNTDFTVSSREVKTLSHEEFNVLWYSEEHCKHMFSKLDEESQAQCRRYAAKKLYGVLFRKMQGQGVEFSVEDLKATCKEHSEKMQYYILWKAHETLSKSTIEVKRSSFEMKKFLGANMTISNNMFYVTDGANSVENFTIGGDITKCSVANVSAPVTRISEACNALGKEVVLFDVHNAIADFPVLKNFTVFDMMMKYFKDPVTGETLNESEVKRYSELPVEVKSVMYVMLNGFTDTSTGKTYYVLGASASKIRSGGVFMFVEGLGAEYTWLQNWEYIENIVRPACFGLTKEQYQKEVYANNECVLLKFETAHVGMNSSSGLNIEQVAGEIRKSDTVNELNGARIRIVDDVLVESSSTMLVPDYSNPGDKMLPFKFKLLKDEAVMNNIMDGSALASCHYVASIHFGAGRITAREYRRFLDEMRKASSVEDMQSNSWLNDFVRDKVTSFQARYARGIKGMVITCPWIDFDPRCQVLGIDVLVTRKSVKYVADMVQPQVLNWTHEYEPEVKKDKTNYQILQSSNITGEQLIKGVQPYIDELKNVISDVRHASQFIGAIRSFMKDDGTEAELKVVADIEAEPRLINEHYHLSVIKEKIQKRAKDLSFARIPCNGQSIHITVDPLYCFHKVMERLTDEVVKACPEREDEFRVLQNEDHEFESLLGEDEVFCNYYTGDCGLWRNPMIHESEPRRLNGVAVDYLWMYSGLCILNPYGMIAMSLGGADYDGDKVLLVFSDLGEFEKAMVDGIANSNYIIGDDDVVKATKYRNHVFERVFSYSRVCESANVGKITNMATRWTDLYHNTMDKKYRNWIMLVLIRMRYAQGWAIDFPKTGINEFGPDGNMFPKNYLDPVWVPRWLYEHSVAKGRPVKTRKSVPEHVFYGQNSPYCVNPDGNHTKVLEKYESTDKYGNTVTMVSFDVMYEGKSPIAMLFNYVQNSIQEILNVDSKPCVVLGILQNALKPEEIPAYESLKPEVAKLERSYSKALYQINLARSIMTQEGYENTLLGLVDSSKNITPEAVACACYYAANMRNGENIKGRRGFPFLAFHSGMLQLLYRNNNRHSLYSMPSNIEIDSVKVLNKILFINEKAVKMTDLPDGEYQVTTICGKPYIYTRNMVDVSKVVSIPETVETVFSVSRFTRYNQKVNSEVFAKILEGNVFSVRISQRGEYELVVNGIVYANAFDMPSAFVGQNLRLIEITTPLVYVPKRINAATIIKEEVNGIKIAWSQMLTFRATLA